MKETKTNVAVNVSINGTQKRLMLGELGSLCCEARAQLDRIDRLQIAVFNNSNNPELWNDYSDKLDKAIERYNNTVKLIQAVAAELE